MRIIKKIKSRIQEKKRVLQEQAGKTYFYDYCAQKLNGERRVLDLGCGVGRFLRRAGGNAVGIDTNLESLQEARKYSDRLVYGSILKLPFSDAIFEGINCHHVIEHFEADRAYQVFTEMDRVLKVGGRLIISTPILWEGFYRDFTHAKPYPPGAIMHYYGERRFQTTKRTISGFYAQREIVWRHGKVSLQPFLFPGSGLLSALSLVIFQWFGNRGFGKLVKTGYTMVLEKIG